MISQIKILFSPVLDAIKGGWRRHSANNYSLLIQKYQDYFAIDIFIVTLQKMKKLLIIALLSVCLQSVFAQEKEGFAITQLFGETRLSFQQEMIDGEMMNDASGFKGRYLNFRIDGQIVKGLTFSYRQRLNKNTDATFFDSTDWLHIDWKPTDRLSLGAGKQVVAIGGYEYDRAPIDLYTCSEFWNNIPCYQMGVSAAYNVAPSDQLLLQVCNSPFRYWAGNNTYAVNLMWYGGHGFWETMWSVNMLQYTTSDWINYIALGNRFNLAKGVHLDVDIMNRAAMDQRFILDDWSLMTEFSVQPSDAVRCFAKYTHDENSSGTDHDLLVVDGTSLNMAALGVEYAPLKNHREAVRLYATGSYSWGCNNNPDGTMQDKQTKLEVGMKIKVSKK